MKKRKVLILCALLIALLGSFVALKRNTIFQRGNPVPYLAAAARLTDDDPYAAVGGMEDVYISRRDEKQALFQMIEENYGAEWVDQLGSSYLFTDGEKNYLVGSEIYWGRFTVWTMSFDNGV